VSCRSVSSTDALMRGEVASAAAVSFSRPPVPILATGSASRATGGERTTAAYAVVVGGVEEISLISNTRSAFGGTLPCPAAP
jgi:hypothetical protein